jgi:formate dehydrogenase iron-sulfur subunit
MEAAIKAARFGRMIGANIAGSAFTFEIEVRAGAGAYVCGEETSLLESLEGKRGVVRAKPRCRRIRACSANPRSSTTFSRWRLCL